MGAPARAVASLRQGKMSSGGLVLTFDVWRPCAIGLSSSLFPMHRITREDLSLGLEACMAASPFLARWVIPLVLEKLSSTYRPAKEDALRALATCCCSYGSEAIQPHLPMVGTGFRLGLL